MKALTNSEIAQKLNIVNGMGNIRIELPEFVIVTNNYCKAKYQIHAVEIEEKKHGKTCVVLKYNSTYNNKTIEAGIYYDQFSAKDRKEILKQLGIK